MSRVTRNLVIAGLAALAIALMVFLSGCGTMSEDKYTVINYSANGDTIQLFEHADILYNGDHLYFKDKSGNDITISGKVVTILENHNR